MGFSIGFYSYESNPSPKRDKGDKIMGFPENYVVIDIETTGLDPKNDSIIEIGAIRYKNFLETERFSSFVALDSDLDPFITSLTGITNDMLLDAPNIESVIVDFYNFIGDDILIGHNVHFDINFLYDSLFAATKTPLQNDFVDTMQLAKKYLPTLPSHKLSILVDYYHIDVSQAHRAIADCLATNELFLKLKEEPTKLPEKINEIFQKFSDTNSPYKDKSISFVGTLSFYDYFFVESLCKKLNATPYSYFNSKVDYVVLSKVKFSFFNMPDYESSHINKARKLESQGVTILSERDFYQSLNIDIPKKQSKTINIKSIVADTDIEIDTSHPLYDKVVVFTGTLSKMSRKEAMQLSVNCGAQLGNGVTKKTNYLIIGNNSYNPKIKDGKSSKQKKAEKLILEGNDLQIISEDVFYDMITD